MFINLVSFLFIFLASFHGAFAQLKGEAETTNKLVDSLNSLAREKDLKNASIGFYAINVKTGKIIADFNSNQSIIPASTMKVITTTTALLMYGKNHRFTTTLQYDGFIDSECVLHGNIYIKGGGDPSLGSVLFEGKQQKILFLTEWADAIIQLGIEKINGNVIADDKIFSGDFIPASWAWGDIGNYYGAGASGLSIFDNIYEIDFESGQKAGDATFVKGIYPAIPYMDLTNEVKSSDSSGDNSYIFGAPFTDQRTIRGSIPSKKNSYKVKGAIPDPPLVAATVLDETLRTFGVEIAGLPTTVRKLKGMPALDSKMKKDFYTYYSPALDDIVYFTNMKSINPYAESLMNHIGLKKYKYGDTQSGAQAVKEFWGAKGIDTEGMYIADGSGLSRANSITARQLVEILKFMATSKEYESFYKSLPLAGRSGSLGNMCVGTCAENNLKAKSGYMNRVRSYAGYVKTKKGDQVAFAFIVNNFNCTAVEMKKKMEKVLVAMAELE